MKVYSPESSVKSQGIEQKAAFTIEASSKAFVILSNTLYSDKIGAVVRELSTNASDAHKESGQEDLPFEVHLPTYSNPMFYIRDYGYGLSHEDCMSLYTTYFRSTKTDSNDYNGCFGLGSKSPFAYTDSFNVESIHNGMKRIYVATMDASGPQFNLLNEEETDQKSGLKVIVPVKGEDINRFETAAARIYTHFKVKPNSNRPIRYSQHTKVLYGNNWEINNSGNPNYVVMGQVGYIINESEFYDNKDVYKFLSRISGLVINVEIGDVEMTPSREQLSYNQKTKQCIIDNIIKIAEECTEKFEAEINQCESIFLARKYYSKSDFILKPNMFDVKYNGADLFIRNPSVTYAERYICYTEDRRSSKTFRFDGVNRPLRQTDSYHYNDVFIVFDPNEKLTYSKQRMLKAKMKYSSITYFAGTKDELIALIEHNDPNSDFILELKDLPYDKSIRSSNSGGSLPCLKFNSSNMSFEDSKFSVKYEAFYIVESRGDYYILGKKFSKHQIIDMIKGLEQIGIDIDIELYTVKPSQVENLKLTRKNWVSFEMFITESINEYIGSFKDEVDLYFADIKSLPAYAASVCKVSKEKSINDIYHKYDNLRKDKKNAIDSVNLKITQPLINQIKNFIVVKNIDYANDFRNKVKSYYPMLVLYDYSSNIDKEDIEYIQSMDRLRELEEKFQNSPSNP